MKKHFLSIFSVFLLICLTSCSALNEEFNSISIQLPEGISEHLSGARSDAINTQENPRNITCTLFVTGDYETKVSKNYSYVSSLDGETLSVNDIPANSKIRVTVEIAIDGNVTLYGVSNSVTVVKGDNYINLTLKPIASVDVVSEEYQLVVFARSTLGEQKMYRDGATIKYSDDYTYNVTLYQNGEYYPLDLNAEQISWEIYKNNSQTEFDNEESLSFNVENEDAKYLIKCQFALPSDTNPDKKIWKSASISFNVRSILATDYILWNSNYYYYGSNLNDLINMEQYIDSTPIGSSLSNIFLKQRSGVLDLNKINAPAANCEYKNKSYYDIENNIQYSYFLETDTENYKVFKMDLNTQNPVYDLGIKINAELSYSDLFACSNDNLIICSTEAIYFYKNNGNEYKFIKELPTNFSDDFVIKDRIILNNTLYILGSSFYFDYENYSANAEFIQNGALYKIDLNNPSNIESLGMYNNSSKEYSGKNTNSYASPENSTITLTVYGPTENNSSYFYAPQKIIAIKEDELYIAESYAEFEVKDENSAIEFKHKNRIKTVDLKDFCITSYKDVSDYYSLARVNNKKSFSMTGYTYLVEQKQ